MHSSSLGYICRFRPFCLCVYASLHILRVRRFHSSKHYWTAKSTAVRRIDQTFPDKEDTIRWYLVWNKYLLNRKWKKRELPISYGARHSLISRVPIRIVFTWEKIRNTRPKHIISWRKSLIQTYVFASNFKDTWAIYANVEIARGEHPNTERSRRYSETARLAIFRQGTTPFPPEVKCNPRNHPDLLVFLSGKISLKPLRFSVS